MLKNLAKLIGLDFEEVKVIKDEFIEDCAQTENSRIPVSKLVISIKGAKNVRRCPICNSGKIKRYGKQYVVQKGVKHSFMTTYVAVELDIYKRRYICEECSKKQGKKTTFVERFSFLDKKMQHSLFFVNYILQEWKYLSVLELSRKFRVSDKMIWNIIRNIDIRKIEEKNYEELSQLEEIYLGIDEHSFSGHDYVLIITELTTGKVIGALKDNKKETLRDWLNNLPPKIMVKIKGYATDMYKGYCNTVKEVLGGRPLHTVDPAHLVFLGNRLTDQVRQMNDWMIKMGYFEKNRKIDLSTKYGLKRGKKPKLVDKIIDNELEPMDNRLLFLTGEERLTDKQKDKLNNLLKEADPKGYVFDIWSQKELLRESLQTKNINLIDKIISDTKKSDHYLIKSLGRTLQRWYEGIMNYFELQITNACTEGKNNLAKLYQRMAFGYRNKQNYLKKLYLCL